MAGNEAVLRRCAKINEKDSWDRCVLCGNIFKSNLCPHSFHEVQSAIDTYRNLKKLGLV